MTRSKTSSKPSLKAAQCSRSMLRRSSAERDTARPALGHRLVHRLEVVQARRQEERQRRADEHVAHPARRMPSSQAISSASSIERPSGRSSRAARESMTTSAQSPIARAWLQR